MRRTQVGIVGAGPAGLLLAHMLHRRGIETIVLEHRSRAYVERRIRAGVLEQGSADLLEGEGVGARMRREGLPHDGIEIRFAGRGHRVDFPALTAGRRILVYGQHEVVKDLIGARLAAGGELRFDAEVVAVGGLDGERATITFRSGDGEERIACDFVAGCDGSHGACRPAVPGGALALYERRYPFAWLGILAEAPPVSHELIYASHERGFALFSMRSPAVSRLYIQCAPDERLEAWPDARIWEELHRRLDGGGERRLVEGEVLQKDLTQLRSYVVEPMRYGRLFLAGDAAHVVPPTGAKGMNLALADVRVLAHALVAFYREGRRDLLEAYSATCLRRVWQAQRFSWWMTALLHRHAGDNAFDRRRQRAELDYLTSSTAAMTSLAENYVGLPYDGG